MASSAAASAVKSVGPLGFPFKTQDPFLFCVYHKDLYPAGNASNMFAPRKGNGADFDWSAPYRMYHGDRLPGFPQHPHRGFETLTLVQEGVCDHTDSLGAAGRYGGDGRRGDLQWMTAGAGCVHGENFPLVKTDRPNTLRLFQICERGVPAGRATERRHRSRFPPHPRSPPPRSQGSTFRPSPSLRRPATR